MEALLNLYEISTLLRIIMFSESRQLTLKQVSNVEAFFTAVYTSNIKQAFSEKTKKN